ncbi:hypothetical protein BJY04DRAFT_62273 [Aspergillus karnatakaensis]|uniref:uncharacterized protein n=1 Tax=Aspergillus karnatakaensis TaxID=1810916 RepID=UPI003CCD77DF
MSTTTTLFTLPLLALISIPLVITASITIFFSTIALFLQLSVITFELCYALLTNLFTIPPSTNWSLLSFTVSGPTTPDRRRSSDYGFLHTPLAYRSQNQNRPSPGPRIPSNPLDFHDPQDTHPPLYTLDSRYHRPHLKRNQSTTQPPGLLGLINGDEDRDFEGLGGWRCPPSYTKSPGYRSGGTTPTSSSGLSDEVDEMAWLSINKRLELPSHPLGLRHSSSSALNLSLHGDTSAEAHLPKRKPSRVSMSTSGTTDPQRTKAKGHGHGQRHHRRSATTSVLLSGFSPAAQGQVQSRQVPRFGQLGQGNSNSLRSMSHTSLLEHWGSETGLIGTKSSSTMIPGAGSYFALQPQSSRSGAKTTSNTTPYEEKKPARISIPSLKNR